MLRQSTHLRHEFLRYTDCSLNEMNNNELFYLHSYMDLLEDDVYNHFIPFCCI